MFQLSLFSEIMILRRDDLGNIYHCFCQISASYLVLLSALHEGGGAPLKFAGKYILET